MITETFHDRFFNLRHIIIIIPRDLGQSLLNRPSDLLPDCNDHIQLAFSVGQLVELLDRIEINLTALISRGRAFADNS